MNGANAMVRLDEMLVGFQIQGSGFESKWKPAQKVSRVPLSLSSAEANGPQTLISDNTILTVR